LQFLQVSSHKIEKTHGGFTIPRGMRLRRPTAESEAPSTVITTDLLVLALGRQFLEPWAYPHDFRSLQLASRPSHLHGPAMLNGDRPVDLLVLSETPSVSEDFPLTGIGDVVPDP